MSNFDMKIGEYFLHILIEETMSLYSQSEGSINPKVTVRGLGRSMDTQPKKDIQYSTNCFWGDHFYFSRNFTGRDELEAETVVVSVFDHSKILKDSLVGSVEMNLSSIYFMPKHAIHNKWFILQNKAKDHQQIYGYIKLSMNLSSISDERVGCVA